MSLLQPKPSLIRLPSGRGYDASFTWCFAMGAKYDFQVGLPHLVTAQLRTNFCLTALSGTTQRLPEMEPSSDSSVATPATRSEASGSDDGICGRIEKSFSEIKELNIPRKHRSVNKSLY